MYEFCQDKIKTDNFVETNEEEVNLKIFDVRVWKEINDWKQCNGDQRARVNR